MVLVLGGCSGEDAGMKEVRLHGCEPHTQPPAGPRLRVAVAAFFSPQETFFFFKDLFGLLAARTGMEPELVQRQRMEEVNDLLQTGSLDLALLDAGAYVAAQDRFPLDLLAVPVVGGRTECFSYIITPRAGGADDVAGLAGKEFAFTDPLSIAGGLWPKALIRRIGASRKDFFKAAVNTWAHDTSIIAVAERQVDGAAVDSLVWQQLNRSMPQLVARTKIISISPAFGIHPLVAPLSTPAWMRDKLRSILLHMHEDAEGRRILQKTMIDRFLPGNESMYDSIRALKAASGQEGASATQAARAAAYTGQEGAD